MNQAIHKVSPSIVKTLRYVEWVFVVAIVLRMVLLLLNGPLDYTLGPGDYIGFSVLGILALLSIVSPTRWPTWQRQVYILLEIGCLLISRLLTDWGLDPYLYLVLVKSCFLLPRRNVICTTIAAGVGWHLSLAQRLSQQFAAPNDEIREQFEASLAAPRPLLILDAVINSATIYFVMSLLIILLCWAVLAERKSRQQASALSQEVETLAADLERTRIARDIHDSLGHTLTTLDVQLEVAQALHSQEPERALQALNRAKHLSNESLQEVRRAVSTMRHGSFDLPVALGSLVEQVKQTYPEQPLTIETQINLPSLPLQVSQQLFLIIKEGLTNIQKHSQASLVKLWAQMTPEGITVGLSDNGIGFSPEKPSTGFGLRGMQERVQLLAGQMTVHSTPGKGTLIQVTIPE
ncbi:MAG: sensor histidine kinase [Cyanobacteria bacterium P01_D01_bin.44]